jgi:ABC-type transport system involved in multi-copper enzyme maturation permease subunit
MLRLLRSEIFRLRRRWMPWVLLLIMIAVGVGFYVLIYVSAQAQITAVRDGTIPSQPGQLEAMQEALRELRPDRVQSFGVGIVSGIGSIMLIVLAASHVGTEFGWGTLRTLLAHGAGRGQFVASKSLSLALFAFVFMVLGVVAAIAGSYLVTTLANESRGGLDLAAVIDRAARGYYVFLPYMALTALIALWARSAGAGIAAGLVVYFTESLIAQLLVQFNRDFANIVNYGLSRNASALTRVAVTTSVSPDPSFATLPDQTQAAIVLGIYTALFIGLAYWRLRTRDITLG